MPPPARRRTRGGQAVPPRDGQPRQGGGANGQQRQASGANGQQRQGGGGNQRRQQDRRPQRPQDGGVVAVLARAHRGVDSAVQRSRVTPSTRATFQAVAILLREWREQVKTDDMIESKRTAELRRIEGLAT
ncbi:MAG: hypothetical protein JO222_06955, partial [Frankiales bacterium]|nr:hypothetical protein [Frankiales bacterium]